MHRPGVELETFRSRVRRPNHYTTEAPVAKVAKAKFLNLCNANTTECASRSIVDHRACVGVSLDPLSATAGHLFYSFSCACYNAISFRDVFFVIMHRLSWRHFKPEARGQPSAVRLGAPHLVTTISVS